MRKIVITVLGLSLFAVAIVFFWGQKKMLRNEKPEWVACADITQSCGHAWFSVRFKETPQVMKPLHLEFVAISADKGIQNIHANFAMKGMEMGFNRYQLIKADQNKWQAEVTLPVCMQGRSDWEMLIEIDAEEGKQRFLVPFSAEKK